MKPGVLAAWPDPYPLPDWRKTDSEIAATPLFAFRVGAVEACHAWRVAAEADGWAIRATYPHELLEQAWTAERDGFKVMGIARPAGFCGARLPVATLSIWADDNLAVSPPGQYDAEALRRSAVTCMGCGASPVSTERVAFVGRYCRACAEVELPRQEHPGWCE